MFSGDVFPRWFYLSPICLSRWFYLSPNHQKSPFPTQSYVFPLHCLYLKKLLRKGQGKKKVHWQLIRRGFFCFFLFNLASAAQFQPFATKDSGEVNGVVPLKHSALHKASHRHRDYHIVINILKKMNAQVGEVLPPKPCLLLYTIFSRYTKSAPCAVTFLASSRTAIF